MEKTIKKTTKKFIMFDIFSKIKNTISKFRINYLINRKFILHNKKYFNKECDTTNGLVLVELIPSQAIM